MVIGSNNIFMGAYHDRTVGQSVNVSQISEEKETSVTQKLQEEMVAIRESRKDRVTISQESRDFLCSDAGYEKMRKDVEDLYTKNAIQQKELSKNNPDDVFWGNTGNQWLVLSENLYHKGFYDEMSDDEVKQAETILAKITAGMDHLSRTLYQTGIEYSDYYGHGANYYMDSNEVNLELESATQALRYFSERYVDEDKQTEFNALIDQFYKHNTEIISGYQAPVESFNKAVHAMHNGQYTNSFVTSSYGQAMKNDSTGINSAIYLGGISHSTAEKVQYTSELLGLFEQLKHSSEGKDSIWKQIEDTFVKYATKDSDDQKVRNYVLEQSKHTINRIKGYWSELV